MQDAEPLGMHKPLSLGSTEIKPLKLQLTQQGAKLSKSARAQEPFGVDLRAEALDLRLPSPQREANVLGGCGRASDFRLCRSQEYTYGYGLWIRLGLQLLF